jgi:antitoxin HigA-1
MERHTMSKSSTTTKKLDPVHPGEILQEDLADVGMSINELARAIHVPVNRLSRLIRRERGVTADTALRLAAFWGTSARYWMNLQTLYELDVAARERPALTADIEPLRRVS